MPEPEELQLPPEPRSVGTARRFITRLMPRWLSADARDRAVLAVSETVANAVRASRDPVTVRLFRRRPAVRIEVHDESHNTAELTPRRPADDAESGRGLLLVEAVTENWGVTHHPDDGKTLWFHVAEPDRPASGEGDSAPGPDSADPARDREPSD
jgi:anti-sigma regulatory factor (Ser/Thr protein kinase)